MNQVIETMSAHRSIRAFTDEPVTDEDVHRAVRAGQAASTSSAIQSYCILRIRSDESRDRLVDLTGGQTKVRTCGAFFVVAGDVRRHRLAQQQMDDEGHQYDARLEAFLLATIDASLFAQNVSLAFESLGYGICYIGGLRNQLDEVRTLLALPEGIYPFFGLCVGRPNQSPAARPRLPLDAVLMDDRYLNDDEMKRLVAGYDADYESYLAERGATPKAWSAIMVRKFSSPERTDLAAFYESQGARLD